MISKQKMNKNWNAIVITCSDQDSAHAFQKGKSNNK